MSINCVMLKLLHEVVKKAVFGAASTLWFRRQFFVYKALLCIEGTPMFKRHSFV